MKTIILFLFACIFLKTSVSAQNNSKASAALVIGPTFPTGHFADNNLYDESSGFAKTGGMVSLEYAKPFSKHWSLLISVSGQRNPINTGAFESSFSKAKIYQGAYLGADPSSPPPQNNYQIYPNWKFDKKSWLYGTLQVGIKGQFPVSKLNKTWLTTEVVAGILFAKSPQLKGSSITDTASAIITQDKSTGIGMGYSIGGGVKHYLNNTIFFIATLKYSGSNKVTFKDVRSTLTTTKGTYGSLDYSMAQSINTANGQQTFNSINLLFGIGIVL